MIARAASASPQVLIPPTSPIAVTAGGEGERGGALERLRTVAGRGVRPADEPDAEAVALGRGRGALPAQPRPALRGPRLGRQEVACLRPGPTRQAWKLPRRRGPGVLANPEQDAVVGEGVERRDGDTGAERSARPRPRRWKAHQAAVAREEEPSRSGVSPRRRPRGGGPAGGVRRLSPVSVVSSRHPAYGSGGGAGRARTAGCRGCAAPGRGGQGSRCGRGRRAAETGGRRRGSACTWLATRQQERLALSARRSAKWAGRGGKSRRRRFAPPRPARAVLEQVDEGAARREVAHGAIGRAVAAAPRRIGGQQQSLGREGHVGDRRPREVPAGGVSTSMPLVASVGGGGSTALRRSAGRLARGATRGRKRTGGQGHGDGDRDPGTVNPRAHVSPTRR